MDDISTRQNSELPADLQRAYDFAVAIDATSLWWEEGPDQKPLTPVVIIHCLNHGDVKCTRVWCSRCTRMYRPEAFVPAMQTEPHGELVTVVFDICDCGLEQLRAVCESCEREKQEKFGDCPRREAEGPIG